MENFSLGSVTIMLAALGIFMLLAGVIFAIRHSYLEKSRNVRQAQHALEARNKYPNVDVFRHSGIFFRVGLAVALGLVTLAFSWTQYERKIYIPTDVGSLEEIEIEVPRTATPPPALPPPPPVVVEVVPDEMIAEDEQPDYIDQTIDSDTPVEAPVQVKKEPIYVPPPPKVEEPNEPFIIVEEMPRFPGCEKLRTKQEKENCTTQKLLEFIYKNIKYPPIAAENDIQGTVAVKFVIEKDGTIAHAQVLRDIGGGCGQEALRVIQLMNNEGIKWKAGMQGGRPVRVQFNLPVKFKLQ